MRGKRAKKKETWHVVNGPSTPRVVASEGWFEPLLIQHAIVQYRFSI